MCQPDNPDLSPDDDNRGPIMVAYLAVFFLITLGFAAGVLAAKIGVL